MDNIIVLSPNDPEIRKLINNPGDEILAMVDQMDIVDAWERLSFPGRIIAAAAVVTERGGRMGKTAIILFAAFVTAAMVYLASESWITSLAVGLFLGYVLGMVTRKKKKF